MFFKDRISFRTPLLVLSPLLPMVLMVFLSFTWGNFRSCILPERNTLLRCVRPTRCTAPGAGRGWTRQHTWSASVWSESGSLESWAWCLWLLDLYQFPKAWVEFKAIKTGPQVPSLLYWCGPTVTTVRLCLGSTVRVSQNSAGEALRLALTLQRGKPRPSEIPAEPGSRA